MAIIIKACLIKTAHSHLQQMEAEETKKNTVNILGYSKLSS